MRGKNYRRIAKAKAKKRRMTIANYPGYRPTVGWEKRVRDRKTGEWIGLGYLVYPRDSRMQKSLKRRAHKITRKQKSIANGNQYRKHFDYWWELL